MAPVESRKESTGTGKTLASRLASFFRKQYTVFGTVDADTFLNAFYVHDPQGKSEMQVLRGSYRRPAAFLQEACGGQFKLTATDDGKSYGHIVGLAEAESYTSCAGCGEALHKSLSKQSLLAHTQTKQHQEYDRLRRQLVKVFWRNFGTRKTNSTLFFKALKEHDPAAKEKLGATGKKPMAHLMRHFSRVFKAIDRGSGNYVMSLTDETVKDRGLCDPATACVDNSEPDSPPSARAGAAAAAAATATAVPQAARTQQWAPGHSTLSATAPITLRAAKIEPDLPDLPYEAAAATQRNTAAAAAAVATTAAAREAAIAQALAKHRAAGNRAAAPK